MEIANIIIALLALIVAVIAIFISIRQAKKSDNISLMGSRINFYNTLCEIIRKYKIFAEFKNMISAKNSKLVFPQGETTNLAGAVLSSIGAGNVVKGLHQITNDINFLDINKYLFEKEIVVAIDEIIALLKKMQQKAEKSLMDKQTEDDFQKTLIALSNILNKAQRVENIKNAYILHHKELLKIKIYYL